VPRVTRPEGVAIAWNQRGEGPADALANIGYAGSVVLQGLIDELASDHRVISYDPRGTGRSSRRGPYEIGTDAEDLIAVLEDAGATETIVIGNGDGADRAIMAAAQRPDLIATVIVTGNLPVSGDDEGLAGSSAVLIGLLTLLENDYRAGLHAIFAHGNPELDEAGRLERVEQTLPNCDQAAAVGRIRAWVANDPIPGAQALGDRLWILGFASNRWFTGAQRARDLLPHAHHRQVADGPMTRPDLTAEAVRALTRTAAR
jgi:pimeloyl-ACP methyl ester carboxylesterase